MARLIARGRDAGERRAADAAARLGERLAAEFPDLDIEAGEAGVTIVGRGLWRRWLAEPMLRWTGGLLR
ncbi:hypothetical protein ACX40Y_04985 [Sphingomonas sp. RS6]